jgi:tetratricopeptide (TPR) repeat protein
MYSPDGRRIASASMDQTVRVWDAATGQPCLILRNTGGISDVLGITPALAYSPDGRDLASASDDITVKVWDAATGRESLILRNTGAVGALAYSPDGRHLVSAGWPQNATVWDAATGQECLVFRDTRAVWALACSRDGRYLVLSAGWDKNAKVWDAATGQELLTLRGHANLINAVAYSPDGRRLASASSDQTVKVWDAVTGQALLTLKGHADEVQGVAYSPDGLRLASASSDHTVKVWDATAITPQRLVERQARSLVQSLITKPLSPDEMSTAIRKDLTISEAVRQQALTWIAPFLRNHVRCLVESLFAKAMLRAEVLAALRADASLHDGVRDEAVALAKTFPENAYALNEASWVVVRRQAGDHAAYERALRQAEAACRVAPEDAGFLGTLGVAYYRVGRYSDAIAALQKCLPGQTINGMDASARYVLAMSHYRLGDVAKALEDFQRAKDSHQRNIRRLPDAQFTPWLQKEAETVLEITADAGKTMRQLGGIVDITTGARCVKLVHEDTGKVLAVAGARSRAGDRVQVGSRELDRRAETTILAGDDGSKAQHWKFEKDGDYYKVVNRENGKVLDVPRNSTEEDVAIITWDDEDGDNQRWSWEGNDQAGRLKSKSSTLVLDVGDDGAVIQRKAEDKAKRQLWRVVAIKD